MREQFHRLSPSAMKERSLRLVGEALQNLQAQGVKITKAVLERETQAIDPTGVGVNRTTFNGNEEVKALIMAATGPSVVQPLHLDFDKVDIRNLRRDRDARRTVRELLKRQNKLGLAMRVVRLEEEVILLREAMARQAYAEAEARESRAQRPIT